MSNQTDGRIVWLDWMKVWAILAIIWGHFFSEGHVYLYVFSVQVFCVISGFLYKKSTDWQTCIKKCLWQLFVPTIIMSIIMQLEAYFRCLAMGKEYAVSIPWFIKWLLLGHRWCMGPCWYFYSLIVMRLIMQALPEKKWAYVLLFVTMSAGAFYIHSTGVEISNANTNVLVCMPFFLIGLFIKPISKLTSHFHNYLIEVAILVISVILVILCGNYNGFVWMYLCEYGNDYALYIIGGMAGTVMLYVVSIWLSRLPNHSMITKLSKGSILIIGLHIIIVRRLTELPHRIWVEDLFLSLLILCSFYVLIRISELYFPVLLGQHNIKNK